MFCGLSRSSAVETGLSSNVRQKLYAPGATLGRLVRTYDCLILVQEARHCKPEGALSEESTRGIPGPAYHRLLWARGMGGEYVSQPA
jgi:hypothetical protein